ncbi:MAG: AAA family ATPase [Candidatus Krumholzibacteriota bacterium]|nr:AAA family ATPase [Candidatus Krumholzibacteriota bacterium]
MYLDFFHLREQPFNVTPDPHFLYMSPSHQEAFANLLYGVRERKGFIVVTGEVGTGKTTLLHGLLEKLDEDIQTVFVFHTGLEFEDLLEMIHEEMGLPMGSRSRAGLLQNLNRHLIAQLEQGRNVALIIDEAQNLSPEILENLRLLSNLETAKDKLLQIVLVGQPELEQKLALPELRQLRQRISVKSRIQPLRPEEGRAYILHRLAVAGSGGTPIFDEAALALAAHWARGVPRQLNVVCDNAMLIAYGEGNRLVTVTHVREAVADIEGRSAKAAAPPRTRAPRRGRRAWRLAAAVAGGGAALAALLWGAYELGAGRTPADFRFSVRPPAADTTPRTGEAGGGLRAAIPVTEAGGSPPDASPAATEAAAATTEGATRAADLAPAPGGAPVPSSPPDIAPAAPQPGVTPGAAASHRAASASPRHAAPVVAASRLQREFWLANSPSALRWVLERCGRRSYRVRPGDYFINVVFDQTGRNDGIVLDQIERMNPHIRDYDHIEPGWVIYLPDFGEEDAP